MSLKPELKLVLTQEMKLCIGILESSSLKLKEFIEKEKENNPAIEVVYKNPQSKPNSESSISAIDFATEEKTLLDYLEEQLGYLTLSKKTKMICNFIINNLNEKGYLAIPKSEIINFLSISQKDLKESFKIIHSLEPIGIGAMNLKECLKIQLAHKNIEDKNLYKIIDCHLEDLATQNFQRISTMLNLSEEEILGYLKEIQKLSPIPARGYNTSTMNNYIIPDAEVYIENDELYFKINKSLIPKVCVKESYKVCSKEDKKNLNRVVNISKSIEKRYSTLSEVLKYALKKQKMYFFKGKSQLQTLTIKEIANHLNLHESTVSRAVKDKYLNSPQGIIQIRSLFILNSETIKIKSLIEELIEYEKKERPLSDMEISNLLKLKNINIARRTVAKYREELGYPSSKDRKM